MNWAEIQGDWQRLSPLLKTQWPQLSDEDVDRIGGSREKLIETVARCYGLARDGALQEVCRFEKEVRFPGAVK